MRIIDVEEPNSCEQYNYLNLDTGLLYLNRYKTVKTYGKKTLLLNDDLLKYIKKWWHDNNMYIGNVFKFLVPSRDGNRLSAHNFNLRLKTIFGFGSRVLRHSYISYKRRTNTSTKLNQTPKEYDLKQSVKTLNNRYAKRKAWLKKEQQE